MAAVPSLKRSISQPVVDNPPPACCTEELLTLALYFLDRAVVEGTTFGLAERLSDALDLKPSDARTIVQFWSARFGSGR